MLPIAMNSFRGMPMIASQFGKLAEQAIREKKTLWDIWKPCCWPRPKSGNETPLSDAFAKLICRV